MSPSNDNPTIRRQPLRTLVLGEQFCEYGTSYRRAEVAVTDSLVVSGQETAPVHEATVEDLNREVWPSLAPAWKDELLLRVLADRFTSSRDLVDYLVSHGIVATVRSA